MRDLGSESKQKLFSGRFALGETIRINGIPYEVIGVTQGKAAGGRTPEQHQPCGLHPVFHLSDFRDTHYLDMIWLEFLGSNYGGVARGRFGIRWPPNTISGPTTTAQCRCSP